MPDQIEIPGITEKVSWPWVVAAGFALAAKVGPAIWHLIDKRSLDAQSSASLLERSANNNLERIKTLEARVDTLVDSMARQSQTIATQAARISDLEGQLALATARLANMKGG